MAIKFRSFAIKVGRCAALLYIGLGTMLWFAQGAMIFPASHQMHGDPGERGLTFEEVRLPVMGQETVGWYVPLDGARGVALFSHGNGGNLSSCLNSIDMLRSFGFSVLAYDYGGYGNSTGTPSEARCYADIHAMWDYLVKQRGVPEKDILLYGQSLGGGPTAELAQRVTPGAIILESTFLSAPDMARDSLVYWPWSWLVRYTFRTKDKIAHFTAPLLILHSTEDEVVPFAHGQALFALAHEPKRFVAIKGGHNTGYATSKDIYRAAWAEFLTPIFGELKPGADAVLAPVLESGTVN